MEFAFLEKINFWGDKGGVCGWSAGSRGVICDGKRSENFTAYPTPLFTVESPSVTNLIKYFLALGGNERCPKGNEFGKRRFPRGSALQPHRSRGTEIEFWTPCDMLYQRKTLTMFWCIRLPGIRLSFALIIFGRSRSRQQRVSRTSITEFWGFRPEGEIPRRHSSNSRVY